MTNNSKTTMDQIKLASIGALELRIRNTALKVWRYIMYLLILYALEILLFVMGGVAFLSVLSLLENLFHIA